MRATGHDQQVSGEHLKLLERFPVMSLWADAIGSLCWHLTIRNPCCEKWEEHHYMDI